MWLAMWLAMCWRCAGDVLAAGPRVWAPRASGLTAAGTARW